MQTASEHWWASMWESGNKPSKPGGCGANTHSVHGGTPAEALVRTEGSRGQCRAQLRGCPRRRRHACAAGLGTPEHSARPALGDEGTASPHTVSERELEHAAPCAPAASQQGLLQGPWRFLTVTSPDPHSFSETCAQKELGVNSAAPKCLNWAASGLPRAARIPGDVESSVNMGSLITYQHRGQTLNKTLATELSTTGGKYCLTGNLDLRRPHDVVSHRKSINAI